MHRRSLLAAGAAMAAGGPARALTLNPALPEGTREIARLASPPEKRDLIQLSDRPPNYESPLDAFATPVTPNDRFFVRYHLSVLPDAAELAGWRLTVGGDAASKSVQLSLDDLRKLPEVEVAAVCQCSGNRRGLFQPHVPGVQWGAGAMGNAVWRGARLRDVLDLAGLRPDALEIAFDNPDRTPIPETPPFRKSIPLAKAMEDTTLVAWAMNGAPLPMLNGFPARIVVPGWTATYWVKHVTGISALAKPEPGFWMQRAYRVPKGLFPSDIPFASQDSGETSPITQIVVNSLVTSATGGASLPARGFALDGIAWDGGHGIRTVEVSADAGASWQAATLGADGGRFAFRPFRWAPPDPRPGRVRLLVRATANDGARQVAQLVPNPAGYHHNVIQSLDLTLT